MTDPEIRADERRQMAREMCRLCREPGHLFYDKPGGRWMHATNRKVVLPCLAGPIWDRHARCKREGTT